MRSAVAAITVALACWVARADVKVDYKRNDLVPVIANKVGPFTNPSEVYQYTTLPFCVPNEERHVGHSIGEHLSGDRKVHTDYAIYFGADNNFMELCKKTMTQAEVRKMSDAVQEDYFFELFLDGLPIWGFIGETSEEDPLLLDAAGQDRHSYIYTHLAFEIGRNGANVVSVNVTTDPEAAVLLDTSNPHGQTVTYSYSVTWKDVPVAWEDRMRLYDEHHHLPTPLEVHWLSIFNSLILVVLLMACLAIVLLRIINHDFAVVADVEAGEPTAMEDEIGWKLVHGDVFRRPRGLTFLTAAVGAGTHLYLTAVCLLLSIVTGVVHAARRGSVLGSTVVIYTLTTFVAGFVSARLNRKLSGAEGRSWVWNILLAVLLFPGVVSCCFMVVNTTAFSHASSQAVPLGTILLVLTLFGVVGIPLGIVGGLVGRRTRPYKPPARPSPKPSPVPEAPFWRSWLVQLCVAGFLPFSAISIEAHFIFSAVWGHKVYTMFGILLVAFALLSLVTACIVVGLVYFQLAWQDYHWWWRSFLSGGMVGVFLFLYALYFYHGHTEMTGLLQAAFFFVYMALAAFSLFLMFGAIGFTAAFTFVHYIYSFSKSE